MGHNARISIAPETRLSLKQVKTGWVGTGRPAESAHRAGTLRPHRVAHPVHLSASYQILETYHATNLKGGPVELCQQIAAIRQVSADTVQRVKKAVKTKESGHPILVDDLPGDEARQKELRSEHLQFLAGQAQDLNMGYD